MVNSTLTRGEMDPETALAMGYAQRSARAGLGALFALDAKLGTVLRTTREPMVGRMRLVWWRDALLALDDAPPPAEPVLRAIAAQVVANGVSGASLASMIDGWEMLFEPVLDDHAMLAHAGRRGATLFSLGASLIDAGDPVADTAGSGWALADLAQNLRDPDAAVRAAALAKPLLEDATGHRWSRNGRPLGALAHLARMRVAARHGPAMRIVRLAWHRLTSG